MPNLKRYVFIFVFLAGCCCVTTSSFAESKYNIKEMTPEVQTALDNRKGRFDKLSALKAKGIIGENNRGYVEALASDPEAKGLTDQENQDRKVIYTVIEKQNNLSDALDMIEKAFAETQRERAASGEKVQNPDGSWVTK